MQPYLVYLAPAYCEHIQRLISTRLAYVFIYYSTRFASVQSYFATVVTIQPRPGSEWQRSAQPFIQRIAVLGLD